MTFIHEQDSTLPIIKLRFIFKNAGHVADTIPGTASLLARLLGEGVDDDYFKGLEKEAISLSFECGFSLFMIEIKCLKKCLPYALKELYNLLCNPRFDEDLLKKIKNTSLGELAALQSDYDYQAKRLLDSKVFKDPIFATGNDGSKESILSINLNDLKAHYQNCLVLSRLHIEIGGDIASCELSCFDKILGFLPQGKPYDPFFDVCIKEKEITQFAKCDQAYIYFASAFNTSLASPDVYLAKIAIFILGAGGFGSRLMEEIRVKRGLAYSAYASLETSYLYSRVWGYLQTKSKSANEAKALVRQIFHDFVAKGITKDELNTAKNFLIKSTPLKYESLSSRLNIASTEYLNALPKGHFKQELDLISCAKLDDLNSYLSKHQELAVQALISVENENNTK